MSFKRNPQFDPRLKATVVNVTQRAGGDVRDQVRSVIDNAEGGGAAYKHLPNRSSAPGSPPVSQSGELFDSIEASDIHSTDTTVEIHIGTKLFYGRFMEGGTKHTAPRPFLTPGLAQSHGKVMERFRGALGGGTA